MGRGAALYHGNRRGQDEFHTSRFSWRDISSYYSIRLTQYRSIAVGTRRGLKAQVIAVRLLQDIEIPHGRIVHFLGIRIPRPRERTIICLELRRILENVTVLNLL